MDQAIKALLEAHLRYELAQFKPSRLKQTIRTEVAALYKWLRTTTLGEVITPDQVLGLIARNVVERPLPAAAGELAKVMSRQVWASRHNPKTPLARICPRTTVDAVVIKIADMQDARRAFIHRLVHSSAYTHQISEVLFTGIKDYLLTENILAQRVPGLASLIKLGKYAVNKTMRPIEDAVEKTVKTYIEGNLGNTIRRSEQSINDFFDQARVAELGQALWDEVAPRRLSEFMQILDGEDIDDFVAIGQEFWLQFRKTAYFKAIYTDLVNTFFDRYADTDLSALAAEFGVTQKIATDELARALAVGVGKALDSGYLEQRLRAHLEGFYSSPEAAERIAALATANPDPPASPTRKPAPRGPIATSKKPAAGKPSAKARKSVKKSGSAD